MIPRETATAYAGWFRCLSDPTRVRILSLLAETDREMSVGEVVAAVDVGQSTVSHHLKLLQQTGFVHVRRQGAASYVRVNRACVDGFPTAAEVIMGRATLPGPGDPAAQAPRTTCRGRAEASGCERE